MKKVFAIALAAALSLTVFAGCGEKENKHENNTDPELVGVKAEATVMAGEEFDALEGVTATDAEDGNLTSKITVSAEGLTFQNGKTTPTEPSEYVGYSILYSVKDSDGAEATAYCQLFVKPAAGEEKTLKSYTQFNVADKTLENDETDATLDWWKPHFDKAEGSVKLTKGAIVFDVTDRKDAGDGDILFSRTMNDLGKGRYEFLVWAKSSVKTYVNMIPKDAAAERWKTVGGDYNKELGTGLTLLKCSFVLDEGENNTSSVELRLHMGKDDSAPADMPNAYAITIYKTALYYITGSDSAQTLYTQNFDEAAADAVAVSAGDGAAATTSYDAEAKAQKVNITSYPTSGGVWSIKVDVALPNVTLEKGAQYSYSMKVTAEKAQGGELLVESKTLEASARANFENLALSAGETTTVEKTFTAGSSVSDPVIRFQIGNAADGVTANTITIDEVRFLKTDEKTENKFNSYYATARRVQKGEGFDTDYPIDFYNGSDEFGSDKIPGLATVYTENGNLVYDVLQGSATDWHSKLVIGFKENPIPLEGNSYYTVRIKIKASKALSCPVIALHEIDTDWDMGMVKKAENVAIGTDWTEVVLTVDEALLADKNCELLFQFGSQALSDLGEVKIEISEITILQRKLVG